MWESSIKNNLRSDLYLSGTFISIKVEHSWQNRDIGDIYWIRALRIGMNGTLKYDEKPTIINSLQLILIKAKTYPSPLHPFSQFAKAL
jgi:hypothetical protein